MSKKVTPLGELPELPNTAFITANVLIAMGLFRSADAVRYAVSRGRFPPPKRISARLQVWPRQVVETFLDDLTAEG